MKIKSDTYFNLVTLVAALFSVAIWQLAPVIPISRADVIGVAMLMGVAYLSEVLAFTFGNDVKFATSIASLPFLASIVQFSPRLSVPAIALAVLASSRYPQRRSLRIASFNIAQAILTAGSAGLLYHALIPPGTSAGSLSALPAFIAAAIIFALSNMGLVSAALATIRHQRFKLVFGEVIGQKGSNLVHGLLASPIALIIALLYQRYEAVGIVLVLLPLLLVRYSFANNVALQKANKDLLKVLIKAIETRDPYTSGHSLRVATLAVAIAEDMGLTRQKIDEVETAALLHDVGKIDPSFSNVIRKPYDLSAEERALIQTHAAIGAELLGNLKSVPQPIVQAVRHHHERMDGAGYPDGLVGHAIPLPARIIMLCDSIDAMLSDRPYRKALPIDRVRQELVRCSGDQFDPEIVKVVLQKDTLARACQLVDTVSGFEDEYLIRAHA
jgi:putative nucleotidyltransferase with HDIG domain